MMFILSICLVIASFIGVILFDNHTVVGLCIVTMFAGAIWFVISALCAIVRLFSRKPSHVAKDYDMMPDDLYDCEGYAANPNRPNHSFDLRGAEAEKPELDLTSGDFYDDAKPDFLQVDVYVPEPTEAQRTGDADAFREELDSLRDELRSTQRELLNTQYELRRAQYAESKAEIWHELTRPRKLGCSGTLAILVLVLILFFDFAPEGSNSGNTGSRTAATKTATTQSATAVPAQSTTAPGLAGSNAYDVVASLNDMGYKLGRQNVSAGYTWSFSETVDGVFISMDITANKDYEICSASFTMTGGDNGFLYFGSTLPYNAADKAKTEELIKSSDEKSITIGDAVWTIHPLNNGKWLQVSDVDYDAWCLESLF